MEPGHSCQHAEIVNRGRLLHQQHLAGALDGPAASPLIMSGQAGIFAGQQASLVGDELLQQVDVFKIQSVNGEIDFRLWTRGAVFGIGAPAGTISLGFFGVGFSWHTR